MRSVLKFLRSMRFGILLLLLIALFSVLGSVIPQGREPAWYVENYPAAHPLLLTLRLNRVFESWYFAALLALLCLNLTLCSLVRIVSLVRAGKNELSAAAAAENSLALDAASLALVERHLEDTGCRRFDFGERRVWARRRFGRYGSFVTHLAILLTVLFGAAALYLPTVTDRDCMPGEALALADGTQIEVASFTTGDKDGKLAYQSVLRVTLPDGRQSGWERVRVNHPLHFGPYKIYQQSYGTAGAVTVTNLSSGGADLFPLTDAALISLNKADGLLFLGLYPDYFINAEGELMLLSSPAGAEGRPVYHVQLLQDGASETRFFFPGDTAEAGGLSFRFEEPQLYPGLRIKHTPTVVNALLIVCFVLMIAGLTMIFFLPPVLVKVDGEGCAVLGPKPEGMRLELERLLNDDTKEPIA